MDSNERMYSRHFLRITKYMRKGKDVDIDKNRQMVLKRVRVRYFLGHFEVLKDFNLLGNAENDVNLSKKVRNSHNYFINVTEDHNIYIL